MGSDIKIPDLMLGALAKNSLLFLIHLIIHVGSKVRDNNQQHLRYYLLPIKCLLLSFDVILIILVLTLFY